MSIYEEVTGVRRLLHKSFFCLSDAFFDISKAREVKLSRLIFLYNVIDIFIHITSLFDLLLRRLPP